MISIFLTSILVEVSLDQNNMNHEIYYIDQSIYIIVISLNYISFSTFCMSVCTDIHNMRKLHVEIVIHPVKSL